MIRMLKVAVFVFLSLFFINSTEASSFSAPTILKVGEQGTELNRVLIMGLTPSLTEVDIYIDNIYQGAATVNNEDGNTDNFFFEIKNILGEGEHFVSAVAWNNEFTENSGHSRSYIYKIEAPSAPTLLIPDENDIVTKLKPRIIGLSKTATFVHIYIDGIYNGKTEVLKHKSGVANFAYKPFLNLERNNHIVWAIAEDLNGRKSKISNILNFSIKKPAISPVILKPVVNNTSKISQPYIVGLVKNKHKVQVYIDKKLNGEIFPEQHESGTTNFAYKPFLELSPGRHLIYSVALDSEGRESLWSNTIIYTVPDPRISNEAVEEITVKSIEYNEKKQLEDAKNENYSKVDDIHAKIATSSLREKNKEALVEIDSIINPNFDDTASVAGVVNENEENQGGFQANIAVFCLFIISVIAWIFWVNKELLKEKREDSEKFL